jgi:hypothetical protein
MKSSYNPEEQIRKVDAHCNNHYDVGVEFSPLDQALKNPLYLHQACDKNIGFTFGNEIHVYHLSFIHMMINHISFRTYDTKQIIIVYKSQNLWYIKINDDEPKPLQGIVYG